MATWTKGKDAVSTNYCADYEAQPSAGCAFFCGIIHFADK